MKNIQRRMITLILMMKFNLAKSTLQIANYVNASITKAAQII